MKIGVIGLGNIAQKAYLPTYSECRHLAEFVLATRNPETRQKIADQYGFTETVGTIEELIEAKIDACFVHVATSHFRKKCCCFFGVFSHKSAWCSRSPIITGWYSRLCGQTFK